MLSRIISLHSRTRLRLLSLPISQIPKFQFYPHHHFSTHNNNNNNNGPNNQKSTSDFWKMSQENDNLDDIFGTHDEELVPNDRETKKMGNDLKPTSNFWKITQGNDNLGDIFGTHDKKLAGDDSGGVKMSAFSTEESWALGESGDGGVFEDSGETVVGGEGGGETEFRPWKFGVDVEEDGKVEDVFGIKSEGEIGYDEEDEKSKEEREMVLAAEKLQLEKEEQALLEKIKGIICCLF